MFYPGPPEVRARLLLGEGLLLARKTAISSRRHQLKTAISYWGPPLLADSASPAVDDDKRRAFVAKAEALLAGKVLAHNHYLARRADCRIGPHPRRSRHDRGPRRQARCLLPDREAAPARKPFRWPTSGAPRPPTCSSPSRQSAARNDRRGSGTGRPVCAYRGCAVGGWARCGAAPAERIAAAREAVDTLSRGKPARLALTPVAG